MTISNLWIIPSQVSLIPDHSALQQEQSWITAAQKDIRNFEPLYRKYYDTIFRFIFRRTDDEALAADLSSQTFYKAMTKLKSYQWQGKPLVAWLYTIALNEVKKHYRDKKPIFVIEENKILEADEIRDEWLHLAKDDMMRLLDELNDADLQIIELKYFESFTFKEIAIMLEMTESAVKMKLYRLLKRLKERLEVWHDKI